MRELSAMPDVSIIIVHYETPSELGDCLRSIDLASTSTSVEVIVVDNASRAFDPRSVTTLVPTATVLRNPTNAGFARGANEGLRRARGRYLLLLNPDTVLAPD